MKKIIQIMVLLLIVFSIGINAENSGRILLEGVNTHFIDNEYKNLKDHTMAAHIVIPRDQYSLFTYERSIPQADVFKRERQRLRNNISKLYELLLETGIDNFSAERAFYASTCPSTLCLANFLISKLDTKAAKLLYKDIESIKGFIIDGNGNIDHEVFDNTLMVHLKEYERMYPSVTLIPESKEKEILDLSQVLTSKSDSNKIAREHTFIAIQIAAWANATKKFLELKKDITAFLPDLYKPLGATYDSPLFRKKWRLNFEFDLRTITRSQLLEAASYYDYLSKIGPRTLGSLYLADYDYFGDQVLLHREKRSLDEMKRHFSEISQAFSLAALQLDIYQIYRDNIDGEAFMASIFNGFEWDGVVCDLSRDPCVSSYVGKLEQSIVSDIRVACSSKNAISIMSLEKCLETYDPSLPTRVKTKLKLKAYSKLVKETEPPKALFPLSITRPQREFDPLLDMIFEFDPSLSFGKNGYHRIIFTLGPVVHPQVGTENDKPDLWFNILKKKGRDINPVFVPGYESILQLNNNNKPIQKPFNSHILLSNRLNEIWGPLFSLNTFRGFSLFEIGYMFSDLSAITENTKYRISELGSDIAVEIMALFQKLNQIEAIDTEGNVAVEESVLIMGQYSTDIKPSDQYKSSLRPHSITRNIGVIPLLVKLNEEQISNYFLKVGQFLEFDISFEGSKFICDQCKILIADKTGNKIISVKPRELQKSKEKFRGYIDSIQVIEQETFLRVHAESPVLNSQKYDITSFEDLNVTSQNFILLSLLTPMQNIKINLGTGL